MPQKTIYVINQFAGTPTSGWGERHFYFSKYWLEQGYKVVIVSSASNHMFREEKKTNGRFLIEEVEGRTFCWVRIPKYNPKTAGRFYAMMVFALRIYQLPLKKLGKPDHIIVSSMPIFPIVPAYRLRKRHIARQLIIEVRDLWPLTPIHLAGYKASHPFIRLLAALERFAYRKSDAIVSLLPLAGSYINAISQKPEKLHYIPNGLSEGILKAEPLAASAAASIPRNKFIIGYAGTIGLANALETFIEAASMLHYRSDIHFVLTGDGYLLPELKKQASQLTNVTFVPRVPKNQVQSLLGHYTVCYFGRKNSPLYAHGLSANKYFDYMLASKPILAGGKPYEDPVHEAACGVTVEPENAEALVAGIVQLAAMQPNELKMLGANGLEYVKKHHDIKILAGRYLELFEQV